MIQRLANLRDTVAGSETTSKFAVHGGQLHVDHSLPIGRCVRSWFHTGYSRLDVCAYVDNFLRECTLCTAHILRTANAPYIFENFRVYAIVPDSLATCFELAGHLIDTLPSLVRLADVLTATYGKQHTTRDLRALARTIGVEVQTFYMRYVAHDTKNKLV